MYRDIIELKDGLTEREIYEVKAICQHFHDNNAGKVEIKEITPTRFVFEGEKKDWQTLVIGYLRLAETPQFWKNVKSWYWEDPKPFECGDLLSGLKLTSKRTVSFAV